MFGRAHSEVAICVVGVSVIALVESKNRNTGLLQLQIKAEGIKEGRYATRPCTMDKQECCSRVLGLEPPTIEGSIRHW